MDFMAGMRVPGLIFANDALIETMATDMAVQQVANVATLPGIVGHSIAMPDIHWGYGFPIGVSRCHPRNRRSGVARRGGFRHQLRRALAAHSPPQGGRDAQAQGAARPDVPRRARGHGQGQRGANGVRRRGRHPQ